MYNYIHFYWMENDAHTHILVGKKVLTTHVRIILQVSKKNKWLYILEGVHHFLVIAFYWPFSLILALDLICQQNNNNRLYSKEDSPSFSNAFITHLLSVLPLLVYNRWFSNISFQAVRSSFFFIFFIAPHFFFIFGQNFHFLTIMWQFYIFPIGISGPFSSAHTALVCVLGNEVQLRESTVNYINEL